MPIPPEYFEALAQLIPLLFLTLVFERGLNGSQRERRPMKAVGAQGRAVARKRQLGPKKVFTENPMRLVLFTLLVIGLYLSLLGIVEPNDELAAMTTGVLVVFLTVFGASLLTKTFGRYSAQEGRFLKALHVAYMVSLIGGPLILGVAVVRFLL